MSLPESDNFQGALWIIASCLAATVMSLGLKGLAGEIHSTQIVVVRCIFGLILILPALYRSGFSRLNSPQLKLHLVRGVFAAVAINLGFYSLTILPLATATVLFFTAPLFVTLLAMPLLAESVGWRRIGAALVGFCGTIIVIDPTLTGFDFRLLIPVMSSLFFAVSLILNKTLSKTDSPAVMMFYIFLVTTVLSLPLAIIHWNWPTIGQWRLLFLVVALFATLRTWFDIRAYSVGEASFVAPFQYLRILFIGVSAWLIFHEVPEPNVYAGAAVIVSSTLYIAQREYRLRRRLARNQEPYG